MADRNNLIKFGPEWLRNFACESPQHSSTANTGASTSGAINSGPSTSAVANNNNNSSNGGNNNNTPSSSASTSSSTGTTKKKVDTATSASNASSISSSVSATGSSAASSINTSGQTIPKISLAKLRYGREEMLALYEGSLEPPVELRNLDQLYNPRGKAPFALNNNFDSESRDNVRSGPSSNNVASGERYSHRGGMSNDRGRSRGSVVHRPNQSGRWHGPNSNWRRQYSGRDDAEAEWRMDSRHPLNSRSSASQDKWDRDYGDRGNRDRSQNWNSNRRPWGENAEEENLPEWAVDNSENCAGSFDASGAFHGYSSDESSVPKSSGASEPYTLTRSQTHGSFSRSKSVEENPDEWWSSEKAMKLSPKKFDATDITFKKVKKQLGKGSSLDTSTNPPANSSFKPDPSQDRQSQSKSEAKPKQKSKTSNLGEVHKKPAKKFVSFSPKLTESKTFDAQLRSDIKLDEASDESGNFQSVMITPNNSLRQKHQNIVSTNEVISATTHSMSPMANPINNINQFMEASQSVHNRALMNMDYNFFNMHLSNDNMNPRDHTGMNSNMNVSNTSTGPIYGIPPPLANSPGLTNSPMSDHDMLIGVSPPQIANSASGHKHGQAQLNLQVSGTTQMGMSSVTMTNSRIASPGMSSMGVPLQGSSNSGMVPGLTSTTLGLTGMSPPQLTNTYNNNGHNLGNAALNLHVSGTTQMGMPSANMANSGNASPRIASMGVPLHGMSNPGMVFGLTSPTGISASQITNPSVNNGHNIGNASLNSHISGTSQMGIPSVTMTNSGNANPGMTSMGVPLQGIPNTGMMSGLTSTALGMTGMSPPQMTNSRNNIRHNIGKTPLNLHISGTNQMGMPSANITNSGNASPRMASIGVAMQGMPNAGLISSRTSTTPGTTGISTQQMGNSAMNAPSLGNAPLNLHLSGTNQMGMPSATMANSGIPSPGMVSAGIHMQGMQNPGMVSGLATTATAMTGIPTPQMVNSTMSGGHNLGNTPFDLHLSGTSKMGMSSASMTNPGIANSGMGSVGHSMQGLQNSAILSVLTSNNGLSTTQMPNSSMNNGHNVGNTPLNLHLSGANQMGSSILNNSGSNSINHSLFMTDPLMSSSGGLNVQLQHQATGAGSNNMFAMHMLQQGQPTQTPYNPSMFHNNMMQQQNSQQHQNLQNVPDQWYYEDPKAMMTDPLDQTHLGNIRHSSNQMFSQQPMRDSRWSQPSNQDFNMFMQLNNNCDALLLPLPRDTWSQPSVVASNTLLADEIVKEMKTEDQILAQLRAQNISNSQSLSFLAAENPMLPSPSTTFNTSDEPIVSSININASPNLEELQMIMQSDDVSKTNTNFEPKLDIQAQQPLEENPSKTDSLEQLNSNSAGQKVVQNIQDKSEDKQTKPIKNESNEKTTKIKDNNTAKSKNKNKVRDDKKKDNQDSKIKEDPGKAEKKLVESPSRKNKKEEKLSKKEVEKEKKDWLNQAISSLEDIQNRKMTDGMKAQQEFERKGREPDAIFEEIRNKKQAQDLKRLQESQLQMSSIFQTPPPAPKAAPWYGLAEQNMQTVNDGLTLAEIQRMEREKKMEQMKEQQHMIQLIAQQQQASLAREQIGMQSMAAASASAATASSSNMYAIPDIAPWGAAQNRSGFWDMENANQTNNQQTVEKPPEPIKIADEPKEKKKTEPVLHKQSKVLSPVHEFDAWCTNALSTWSTNIDVPTFISFLKDIESPFEIKDYVKFYLADTKESNDFSHQFLEQRSKLLRTNTIAPSDDLCSPAVAVNPLSHSSGHYQEVKGKGKKTKKNKMLKVDARILGFSVTAAEDRINVGDIDLA